MATKAKGTVVDLAAQLAAGTNKHLAGSTQVLVAGGAFTPAQVVEKLQALAKLRTDVDAAKASTKAKLAAEKANMAPLRTFMDAFVTFVKAAYGTSPDVLADFGLHPKARTPQTVQTKAASAAKRAATRAARHTMGSKQKKSVKGDVIGITVTPVTALRPVATQPASTQPASTQPASTQPASPTANAALGTTPAAGATPHTP
jgi:hypothetical protein